MQLLQQLQKKINMQITKEQLIKILPTNKDIAIWLNLLNKHLPNNGIETKEQIAMFIAQTSHESSCYNRLSENLNYSAQGLLKVFPRYFNSKTAADYQRQPIRIANRVYANRMGNGSEASGDGWKYRGAGLIQTTGKNNHEAFAKFMEMGLDEASDYLRTREGALLGAIYYWNINKLASYTSVDRVSDIINIGRPTVAIGDAIGYAHRKSEYDRIVHILS